MYFTDLSYNIIQGFYIVNDSQGGKDMRFTKIFVCFMMLAFLFSTAGTVCAAGNEDWVWISSDSKYSKYYSPSRVRIIDSYGGVATRLEAWTRTNYNYEGAVETVANYEIQAVLQPEKLAYSLARVEINPQNRTIEYVQEDFYDTGGNIVWSKLYNPRTVKEINSQSFDEAFYTVIVDSVFRYGETERSKAADRWTPLWHAVAGDGSITAAIADTTTMRLKGENIIFWEWLDQKDASGTVLEIKFMKMAVNLPQGTQKVIQYKYWDQKSGWKDLTAELDGLYTVIKPNSYEAGGLAKLRAYAAGYQYWLNRYSLDNIK